MKNLYLMGAAILVFVSCNSTSVQTLEAQKASQDDEKTKVEKHIHSSIQGKERDVMREVLLTLPEEHRENVTFIDAGGQLYSNKPELSGQVQKYKDVGKNKFSLPQGELLNLQEERKNEPELQPLSLNYDNQPPKHGIYRRVWSKDGYSYERAIVHLPGLGSEITSTLINTTLPCSPFFDHRRVFDFRTKLGDEVLAQTAPSGPRRHEKRKPIHRRANRQNPARNSGREKHH